MISDLLTIRTCDVSALAPSPSDKQRQEVKMMMDQLEKHKRGRTLHTTLPCTTNYTTLHYIVHCNVHFTLLHTRECTKAVSSMTDPAALNLSYYSCRARSSYKVYLLNMNIVLY